MSDYTKIRSRFTLEVFKTAAWKQRQYIEDLLFIEEVTRGESRSFWNGFKARRIYQQYPEAWKTIWKELTGNTWGEVKPKGKMPAGMIPLFWPMLMAERLSEQDQRVVLKEKHENWLLAKRRMDKGKYEFYRDDFKERWKEWWRENWSEVMLITGIIVSIVFMVLGTQ